ncbi:RHS repeat-associated core domain-containing protein [Salmonella enterica]|nr:RHS repeat-associated core domain-containing protein [Salmonella enterica]EEN9822037.1 RHS repeat-associated core domain-containing protein [Salmonella enterica]EIG9021112.1 RHS repeat-associated core domain-containing protein [Salmonella enterica]EIL7821544.1 RHS repeat-associated core domain-containing protein [Salmonella enterica]EIL8000304.1 RHS repeat-associated core domain-containing protein [Salmonella enterica]
MTLSLLTLDAMGSPKLARSNREGLSTFRHAPFGADKLTGTATNIPGFNGQRRDPVSHSYHLGNGYRAYNPLMMRFNCPDNLSPFGTGGINPYAYCAGDPINRADPSGHISWQAGLGIGLGILGIIATAGAAAMAISAAGGIGAALSAASTTSLLTGSVGLAADAVGIAGGAVSDANPELSATLGWVSMGVGIGGIVLGSGSIINQATKGLRQRLKNIKRTGLSGRGAVGASRQMRNSNIQHPEIVGATVAVRQNINGPYTHLLSRSLLDADGIRYERYEIIHISSAEERESALMTLNQRFPSTASRRVAGTVQRQAPPIYTLYDGDVPPPIYGFWELNYDSPPPYDKIFQDKVVNIN